MEIRPGLSPAQIIEAGLQLARGPVALACSFSAEDIVVLDILLEVDPQAKVFAIDTGRLNEETYQTAEAVKARWGIDIEWHFPERGDVEKLVREKGHYSFRDSLENRHECCHLRKVVPLGRALSGLGGWITGLRREQSVTRTDLKALEWGKKPGGEILKINPIIDWTHEDVWNRVKEKSLPVNPLHLKGYPSIGCEPCTRAISQGEHPRAGRWWWEDPEHKECGLHR